MFHESPAKTLKTQTTNITTALAAAKTDAFTQHYGDPPAAKRGDRAIIPLYVVLAGNELTDFSARV